MTAKIGLGTWQLQGRSAAAIVAEAIESGYRHIDTAQMYGNEEAVGEGLRRSGIARSEVFLTSKVADDNHEPDDLDRGHRLIDPDRAPW